MSEIPKPFDAPVYVTRPLLPDLSSVIEKLEEIWKSQWLTNNGPQHVLLEQKLTEIRTRFLVHDKLMFSSFFTEARSKRHLIVTFLALLEMVRLREVLLYQKKAFDEIQITKWKEKP